jgi:hypothetical protein
MNCDASQEVSEQRSILIPQIFELAEHEGSGQPVLRLAEERLQSAGDVRGY